jgi:tetratricopeptide (TPR) repeat protein
MLGMADQDFPTDPRERPGEPDDGGESEAAAQGVERTEQALAELAERETAYGLLQRGRQLMRRRHNAQAAVLLERARRLEPGKGSIVESLARAYYNSGQHQRAAEAFGELLEIEPSSAYAHFGLGQALKQIGQREEARTHLRLAVALAPHSALYRQALDRLD